MKIYLSLPIAILIFIFSANYAIDLLENDANEFTEKLQQIETAVQEGNPQEATAIYNQLAEKWQTEYKKWAVLVDHDKLDEINRLLGKIKIDLSQNQSSGSDISQSAIQDIAPDIAEVIYLFQSIPRTEKITWQNIL